MSMTKQSEWMSWLVALGAVLLAMAGCKAKQAAPSGAGAASAAVEDGPVSLEGAGATFPYPLYSKWLSEYAKVEPSVRINYQSIGSGGGIRQMIAGTVDFGASDAPLREDEAKKAPGKLIHLPTTLGAVAIAVNVKEVATAPLKLTPELLAGIYLGEIQQWNDPKVVADNPALKDAATPISVVYRSDGSGTTAVFTDYLAKVSPRWKDEVGASKSVRWPKGLGAKGNEGVTGQVKTVPGAIGYVELAYATQNQLSVASLRNRAGDFVAPSIEAVSAAAAGVEIPDALHLSITDSASKGAYPISAFTYLIVYEDMKDARKGKALAKFLAWAMVGGQRFAAPLDYAPLPPAWIERVQQRLKTLHSGQVRLLSEG